jgi:hypothetical protein
MLLCISESYSQFCSILLTTRVWGAEKGLLLCLPDHFRVRSFVRPELLRSKSLSTGAASPLWVGSDQVSRAKAEPAIFAGIERHHQFTATLQALSLSHSHVVTTRLAVIVWSQLNTVRYWGQQF